MSVRDGPVSARAIVSISAQDPSGIDLIELYEKTSRTTGYEWIEVALFASFPAPPGAGEQFQVELEVDRARLVHGLDVVVFDRAGIVARTRAF